MLGENDKVTISKDFSNRNSFLQLQPWYFFVRLIFPFVHMQAANKVKIQIAFFAGYYFFT